MPIITGKILWAKKDNIGKNLEKILDIIFLYAIITSGK